MIELRLLGPALVTVDGGPPPRELLWRKNVALLMYLALSPDRRATRTRLAGLLWGDRPDKAARGSLAEALRIVRSCKEEAIEDVGGDYVRLADEAVETDTDRLAALMEKEEVGAAAGLVAGELAEGLAIPDAWEFEEWLAGQRRAWLARSEEALVAAARSALASGSPARAHELAERALALVPASETACRIAMRSLCLRGDRGAALERYAVFSERLEREIGIAPSEETSALAERVRHQRRWRLPATRREKEPRGAESRRAPLVGRSEALNTLVREWEACRGGACRVAVISGDAGTGRTRLLEELLARARLDGGRTAVVRALPADADSRGEVLETLARAAGIDPAARGSDLVEEIHAATDAAPLVLAVDDAGWADIASLDELRRVASRASETPLMLIMVTGTRPGPAPVDAIRADLGRDLAGAVVALDRLGPEAVRELTAWAMPGYDAEAVDRLSRRVEADTAGYALLAVELLHGVAHGLSVSAPRTDAWPATGRTLDQTRPGDLPDALVAAIRVGFRVLTPDAQRVLSAAAVLGPPASPARLAEATDLEEPALTEALDELEWERWLLADARGYAFTIPLVEEIVARDMVTPGRRQRIVDRLTSA
jgi:DNA-binding SARP family transcriptional activator